MLAKLHTDAVLLITDDELVEEEINGNPLGWHMFWGTFEITIDNS